MQQLSPCHPPLRHLRWPSQQPPAAAAEQEEKEEEEEEEEENENEKGKDKEYEDVSAMLRRRISPLNEPARTSVLSQLQLSSSNQTLNELR